MSKSRAIFIALVVVVLASLLGNVIAVMMFGTLTPRIQDPFEELRSESVDQDGEALACMQTFEL